MYYVLTALLVAIGVLYGARWFVGQDPALIARIVANMGKYLMILFGGYLMLRGSFFLAFPLIAMGIAGLMGFGRRGGLFAPSASRAAGQKSQVRSRMLEMELNHDTGEIDGMVLNGDYAGRQLSELTIEELVELFDECLTQPDQSASLLQAFLDKNHSDWRESAGEAAGEAADEQHRTGEGGGAMTEVEAYEVLGLPMGAAEDDVRVAHRALMKQFHPDRGGSSYLAAKINQAKDILLDG